MSKETTQKEAQWWRQYWQYFLTIVASLFIVWQSLAIIIGPAPGSYLMSKIYPIFKPYLVALHLNNEWGFFAPDPAKGSLLRYIVTDGTNTQHIFKLTEKLKRSDHGFLRYTSLYLTIGRKNEEYVDSATHYLCHLHKNLNPQKIQFFIGHQQSITPKQFLAGNRPLDDNHMEVEYLPPLLCEKKK